MAIRVQRPGCETFNFSAPYLQRIDRVLINGLIAVPLLIALTQAFGAAFHGHIAFFSYVLSRLLALFLLGGVVAPLMRNGIRRADHLAHCPALEDTYWRLLAILGLLATCGMIGRRMESTAAQRSLLWMTALVLGPLVFVYLFRAPWIHALLCLVLGGVYGLAGLVAAFLIAAGCGFVLGPIYHDFQPPRDLVRNLFHTTAPVAAGPRNEAAPASTANGRSPIPPLRPALLTSAPPHPGASPFPPTLQPAAQPTIPPASAVPSPATIPSAPPQAPTLGGRFAPALISVGRNPGANIPAEEPLTDEMVVAALRRGAARLRAEMETHHAIETRIAAGQTVPWIDRSMGEVALGTYALLVTGKAIDDAELHYSSPEMIPHINALLALKSDATYTVALQTLALAQLPGRADFRRSLALLARRLYGGEYPRAGYGYQLTTPDRAGHYPAEKWDNSNTQYGILGVWAAAESGVRIPESYWKMVQQHWRCSQCLSGGWPYTGTYHDLNEPVGAAFFKGNDDARATMTLAGMASLFVIMDKLDHKLQLEPSHDAAMEAGMEHVMADYAAQRNLVAENLYYAYGLERVGLAGGYKYLAKTNWYRAGAAHLLKSQAADGAWAYEGSPLVGTAYALLFLARGRNPVIFNKLQYDGPWNARPRDSATLANWLGRVTEKNINWQVVDCTVEPEDWLDAPALLITGHGDPKFSADQVARLTRYVNNGGIIVSTADGVDAAFTAAIRDRYAPAIAGGRYAMRPLPADHPVYTLEYKRDAKLDPARYGFLGLSNGVRELWIHSPVDLGATWQRCNPAESALWQITENLYFYLTGKVRPRTRLQSLAVDEPAGAPSRQIRLVRLQYPGNWDPEPGAWNRLARLARCYRHTDIAIDTCDLDALERLKTPLLHLTGTGSFTLSAAQTARLQDFITAGGFILADAANGNEPFAASFRHLLGAMFPQAAAEPVPDGHPLLSSTGTGSLAIDHLEYRRGVRPADRPEIFEYKLAGRPIALLSEGDITSGLLGTNTWGIRGFAPQTAQDLAWNMLLYAAGATGTPGSAVPTAAVNTTHP